MYIKDKDGNYVPAATITGADGREVSLRSANGYIQWRYPDTEWENLVALSTLQGAKGTDGTDGKEVAMRVVSDTLQWRLGTTGTWQSLMQMATATQDATFGGAVVGSKLVLAAGTATGGGDKWELVASAEVAEIANSLRVTFDACSAVYIQLQYAAVEDSLGSLQLAPNCGSTFYTGEQRAAAAWTTTSANNKRGLIAANIDTRVGSMWTSQFVVHSRGDGSYGSITPNDELNTDIGSATMNHSVMRSFYFTSKDIANGITSITAYGAGMNVGTNLKVWGIKL